MEEAMRASAKPADTGLPERIGLACPQVGEEEIEAVRAVFQSGTLTGGPATARFEQDFGHYHRVSHAVAFANGTVALHAMYVALGIGPGDEVIVPSMTFIASATSILHAGATPVFADVQPDTFNLDPVDVARRLTSRTKAILAVHYGGQPADMDELAALATDAGVVLLEDAAEAHGAWYHSRPVGGLGRAAMFSFTPTKNMTTGEGGMVTTDDGELAERLSLLRNHGQTSQYRHAFLGYNWRITEMQAAMGCVQLTRLSSVIETKQRNAMRMAELLVPNCDVRRPVVRGGRTHVYMLYTVLLSASVDRDLVAQHLQSQRIETRLYFPPAHCQPIFKNSALDLPVTEDLANRMLSLPFHSRLSEADLDEVASKLTAAVSASRR